MGIAINNEKEWIEAIVDGNCEFKRFYDAAIILEKHFEIKFTSKLNDFDTAYWDFKYKESNLCLHYNIYLGISIFPIAFTKSSSIDNENVIEIGELLFGKLKSS